MSRPANTARRCCRWAASHLTGGSKKEGRVTCDALMDLSNCKPVELTIDGGATVVVQAGCPPIVNGVAEERMRVGCGSATIGMFAKQWQGKVDESSSWMTTSPACSVNIRPASCSIFPTPESR